MLLARTKSRVRFHHAPSFKDIHILLSDDAVDTHDSPLKPSICHRTRSSVKFLSQSPAPPEGIRIPGADNSVVVYFTSLRIIRSTFDDCKAVLSIFRAFRVPIDERDLSMDSRFTDELMRILGVSEKSKLTLPMVFIGGSYIGGAEEVRRLHESGELNKYVERLPPAEAAMCDTCGGYRFILCEECSGSHKCFSEKAGFRSCTSCIENGLIRCPSCSPAPL